MANNKYHLGQDPKNGYNGQFTPFNQNPERDTEEDEIDLKQLFYTLWSRKWIIIGAVLFFGLIALGYAYISTPIYKSEGSLLIKESSGSSPLGGGNNNGIGQLLSSAYGLGVGSTLANELQVLRSRKLSKMIADTLMEERLMPNGRQFPVLFRSYPDDSTMTTKDSIALRIRNNITFTQANQQANVVDISYDSPSPYEAAHIVNMSMMLYKQLSTHRNRSSASSAVNFLEKERNRIKKNLNKSEDSLRIFMNNHKLIQVDTQTQQLIQQMANLEASREQAKAKLVAAKAAIKQYKQQLNKIKPGLADQYADAVGPNVTKLQYAKSELQVKKQKLLAQNPRLNDSSPQIKKLDRKISSYKNRIKQVTQNLINQNDEYLGFLGGSGSGVAQNISNLNQQLIQMQVQQTQYQAQTKVINSQLRQDRNFFNNLPDNMIRLAKLKRAVKINNSLYETVSQQYAQTELMMQTQFGLGQTIDSGFIPKKPVKPQKKLYLLVGLVLGGILSIGYVLVREAFNITIDGVEKMKDRKETLLAVIPSMDQYLKEQHNKADTVKVQGKNISTGMVTILDTISPISESFRQLESNLIYSNPDVNMKSVMMTSCGKGEGKTTTIANLGVVLAEAGYNTVIADVDFRRPNLHNMFGMSKKPGLVEAVFGDIPLEEGIQESIASGLSILPAGRKPANAAAISQSQAFLDVISKLENRFDFVLIDTAPIGIINDASALLRQTDGVVVLAKFGQTTEVQLDQTLEQLRQLQVNISGTVLTAFDHTQSSDYRMGSGYYKQVYQDYNDYKEEA